MKTKILLWSISSVIGFAIAGAVAQRGVDTGAFPAVGEPQVITLTNGMKLRLLGTTYGNYHMAPGYETLGTANWIYTAPNTIVVWIETEHPTNQWPNYELLASDRASTACVNIEKSSGSHVQAGMDIQGFVLNAFPRRDKETVLRVRPYGGGVSKQPFVISNRFAGSFTNWIPKPLPDKQSDGDLEVTLTRLIAGAPNPYFKGRNPASPNEPVNQCVRLDFDMRQNGRLTTNWNPGPVETSDATGNWVRGSISAYPTNGIYPYPPVGEDDGYFYQPGLWPDEPAWKVRLEFIRRSNFSGDEIVTFTNVPVKTGSQQDWDDEWSLDSNTNFIFIAQTTVNGVHLKLLPPLLVPDQNSSGQKFISVIIEADPGFKPQGMNLTVMAATDDQGHDLWHPFKSTWAGHYDLDFPNVREVKSLNLKLALHKSRFVEFTVKPSKQ